MSRFGFVLDAGNPKCKHQSLASMCGYEYCLNPECSYRFIGHCSKCAQRSKAIEDYIKKRLKELKVNLYG